MAEHKRGKAVEDNVATIVGGIIVAALSGVTFIAYKHPRAYTRLMVSLYCVIILLFAGGFGWMMGCSAASRAAYSAASSLTKLNLVEARDIKEAGEAAGVPNWYPITLLAVSVYLSFLWTFPMWLLDKEPPRE
jgi:hypothetical protein